MKIDFTQAQKLILEYCRKKRISKVRTAKLCRLVTEPKYRGYTTPVDRRDIWLALSACNQRDAASEVIFKFMSLYVTVALAYPDNNKQVLL